MTCDRLQSKLAIIGTANDIDFPPSQAIIRNLTNRFFKILGSPLVTAEFVKDHVPTVGTTCIVTTETLCAK